MITKRKRKPAVKVGKVTGTVRLSRKEMERTRMDVYFAAQGYCQMRGILLAEIIARDDMTPEHKLAASARIKQNCWGWVSTAHGHDAHLRTKRNGGDELSNRIWSCPACHLEGDHGFYGKPCPPKEKP